MAKLGFEYKVDTDTDKALGGGGGILPHMYAKIWAESITAKETKDQKGYEVEIAFEVQEPEEFGRRKFWSTWTILHNDEWNHGAYKFGKPRFDKLVRATGNDPEEFERDPDTDHLILKTFVVEIGIEIGNANPNKPGEFYKDKNVIKEFFFDNPPELGVIGDGTQGKKQNAPANDNKPARAAPAAAAPAATGRRPWK